MGDVIDGAAGFKRRQAQQQFGRLWRMVQQRRAEVERDPWPYLESAAEETRRLRRIIEAAREALQQMPMMVDEGAPVELLSIEAELHQRQQNALAELRRLDD